MIKSRLSALSFLEFAVWGAYLTSMSNYLGTAGMGDLIAWFFAIQGLVCIVMPAFMGIIADKYLQPQKLLSLCQLAAAIFMGCCWWLGYTYPKPDRLTFVICYTLSTAFYMPTVALSNSVAFRLLRSHGGDTVTDFPRIRVFGTIGFIAAMLFVNCAYIDSGFIAFSFSGTERFQFQCWQFLISAILGLIMSLYCLTLPQVPILPQNQAVTLADKFGLKAFAIFRSPRILVFFIFSMLMGMCLKVTNGYAGPFITSFLANPDYAATFGAGNATLLTSISQASEALCILLIPLALRRFGIKKVIAMSMIAWALRFGTFALGNPGPGLWLLVFSMIIYGVAFDFFNIAGAIFIENETDKTYTASAQGLWMMTTNGIGASVGTLIAGEIIDYYCHWQASPSNPKMAFLIGDWPTAWYIFALFALITAILFIIFFPKVSNAKTHKPNR